MPHDDELTYGLINNGWRPHVSLGKDAPDGRPIERIGDIVAHAILGGLITGTHESSFWKREGGNETAQIH
jgi:hypothetical protein